MGLRLAPLLIACCGLLTAQDVRRDTAVVTGSYEPVPLEESNRSIDVFDLTAGARLLSCSVADFLRLDPALDVQARTPDLIQADLSIQGGNFGSVLVLLNGMRINDPQTGHFNLDIPVPLDAIGRIEVLKGSGSAIYGSDAVDGVVNVITRSPESTDFRLRTAVGNFGTNQQSGALTLVESSVTEQLSFSRDFSTGFMPDRDYRNLSLASITHWRTRLGATDLLLAGDDRPYGADQFYAAYPSWERTRSWYASVRQELGENTEVDFSFRRHTDLFVLFRDNPAAYTNRHIDKSWDAAVRRHNRVSPNITLSYGMEGYHDSIDSNNLGDRNRSRGAGYAAIDIRALRRFSITLGAREEVFTGLTHEFSPTAAVGYWLSQHFKLRASASHAYRLPSYTELYYNDPQNIGNVNLRPEQAWNYDAGLDWNASSRLRGEIEVFNRRERDGIDYVRASPADLWQAANFDNLNFTGVEASVVATLGAHRSEEIAFRYSALHGAEGVLNGLQSKYIFNYPRQSGVISWYASLPAGFLFRTRIGVLDRLGRNPYALWDAYIASTKTRLHPFLQLTNLTNTDYQEIAGVDMPSRGIIGGIELVIIGKK